jgi:hypothetical protein
MESWQLSEADILAMPTTRRHRIIQKKVELEKKREEKQKADASAARSRMRR